jgi:hypothetical protein
MKTSLKIPPIFSTPQEEATFWDTHDVTEYAASLTSTPVTFRLEPTQGITVRFRMSDLGLLRALAHRKRIGVTTLIRMAALEYAERVAEK